MFPRIIDPPGGATEELLAKAERVNKIVLPPAYRDFLLRYNGGQPEPGWIPCAKVERSYAPRKYEAVTKFDGVQRFLEKQEREDFLYTMGMPAAFFRIAESGDESIVLLRLDGKGPDRVYFWDIGEGDYADAKESGRVLKIAPSFADFIQSFDYPPDTRPWLECIHKNDVEGCRRWLDSGGNPNVQSDYCNLPLEEAAFQDRLDIVKLLVERKAKKGSSFLYSVQAGHREIARFLAPLGVNQDDATEALTHYRWVNEDAILCQALGASPSSTPAKVVDMESSAAAPPGEVEQWSCLRQFFPGEPKKAVTRQENKEAPGRKSAMRSLEVRFPTAIDSIAISPDERWLAVNHAAFSGVRSKNPIQWWDLQDLKKRPQPLSGKEPESMLFSPDGKSLYYRGTGRVLYCQPFPGPEKLARRMPKQPIGSFAFVPHSTTLLATTEVPLDLNPKSMPALPVLLGLDLVSKKSVPVTVDGLDFSAKDEHGLPINSLGFVLVRPDGAVIAARVAEQALAARTIRTWTYPAGKNIGISKPARIGDWEQTIYHMLHSPDGCFLVGKRLHDLVVLDGASLTELVTLTPSGVRDKKYPRNPSVRCIAFTPDGQRLAAGCMGGKISFWETGTWRKGPDVDCACEGVYALAFSRSGRMFAGVDCTLSYWEGGAY